jgi:hypothetical protein
MENLGKLILDNNKLTRINLQNTPNLQVLSCIENRISEIYGLAGLTSLIQLFVDSNELNELPPLPSVQTLSASHNKLSSLPIFPSLQLLNVSFNLLNHLPKISSQITQLIVASNCLTTLPFGMKHLEVLEASNNKLSNLDFLSSSSNLSILKVAFNEFPSLDQVIWKVCHCPLSDADFSGLAVSDSLYLKVLSRFPYLEAFNDRAVTEEDRVMLRVRKESSSSEEKFQEILENLKPSSKLEIPELSQGVSLKIDPNSSSEMEKPKSSLCEFNSPRSVCLTPSHTETLSVIPSVLSPRPTAESDKGYMSYKMREMYRSIVSSMKKNISKQFFDFAQEHDIPNKPRHHHHHCKHHTCRKNRNRTSIDRNQNNIETDDVSLISKKSVASQINRIRFNEKTEEWTKDHPKDSQNISLDAKFETGNDDEFRVSFSPIPTVQRNKIEEYFIKGILKYCKNPPRPVLKHEKTKTLIQELREECQEFLIVTSFFAQFSVKVMKVLKCFMFDAVSNKSFDWVGFFYASQDDLVQIAKDVGIFLGMKVRLNENVKVNGSCCILCAAVGEQLTRIGPGFVETSGNGMVVPSYVVWYGS